MTKGIEAIVEPRLLPYLELALANAPTPPPPFDLAPSLRGSSRRLHHRRWRIW